ncbi:hypothetical protein OAA99_02695, partial [Omnitrophica bacterium]|nr:hypothetical protein [Candidatus Omnitrophota bacterium]
MADKKEPLFIAFIIIIGFIVYANSLNGEFVWDDNAFIKNNQYIKSWSYIPKPFTENLGTGVGKRYISYRPLKMLSYMMDYSLWRLNVKGYHLTSIALHILAGLSIYWLITLLFSDKLLSFLTSLLFVAHPVHTAAVASISGRADPLMTVFLLVCFALYIKNTRAWSMGGYISMLFCYLFALLSRENSIVLPFLLLIYHYAFRERLDKRLFSPLLALAGIYIAFRIIIFNTLLLQSFSSSTLLQRLPGFFIAITRYARLFLLPFDLHMLYGKDLFSWSEPGALIGVIILFSAGFYALRKRESDRLSFFAISWFIIALLPQSNLYPLNAYMAEHWLYIPSIGAFLILARGLTLLYKKKGLVIIATIFTAGLLAFYSFLTIKQNCYWKDPITFCERTLRYVPESAWMYNNLGNARYVKGEKDK